MTRRRSFSVIELLASMALLVIVIGLTAMVLNHARQLWALGTERTETTATARAALSRFTRDAVGTVTGTNATLVVNTTNLVGESNFVFFRSLWHATESDDPWTEADILYRLQAQTNRQGVALGGYELARCFRRRTEGVDDTDGDNNGVPDDLEDGTVSAGTVARDVSAFAVGVVHQPEAAVLTAYDSRDFTNSLPAALDVYLEILPEGPALTLRSIGDKQQRTDYTERHTIRFSQRVRLWNHAGSELDRTVTNHVIHTL